MDEFLYSILGNIPTIGLIAIIGVSLYLLGKGADEFVEAAIGLSVRWGIPKVIVGATIVSLGTTIPEVTVSVMASLKGSSDMALGNAVGSIITNTALILGLAALIGHLPMDKKMLGKQGRNQLIFAILLAIISMPILGNGENGLITKLMGFGLLAILVVYMYFTVKSSRDSFESDVEETEGSLGTNLLKLFFGLVLVILSSKVLIPSVEVVALRAGIPESIIAATLVAFGTSLPELMTSLTAVRKGHGELAVGNVTGANILNILFVVGSSAAVSKSGLLVSQHFFKLQIPIMLLVLGTFYLFTKRDKDHITKFQGGILLGIYILYLIMNFLWI